MMNSELLVDEIKKRGLTQKWVAQNVLNLSRQGFYKKLTGQTEFTQSEIEKLSIALSLDEDTRTAIFFAGLVDC